MSPTHREEDSWSRALDVGVRAAGLGFDWPDVAGPLEKIREETEELAAELGGDPARVAEEIGDLLFAIANLCRHVEVSPASALQAATGKFERRFRAVEAAIRDGSAPTLEAMEAVWRRQKE